jgi:hypothetical protein
MNRFRITLLSATTVALLFCTLSTTYAQTAQEIVAKHIEALGGKEKLQSINSIFIEGVAVTGNGAEIDAKLWKVYDRLFRQEVTIGGSSVTTIVTPGRGWVSNQQTNGLFKSLPADQLKALQPQIDPAGPLADYAAKGCQVHLEGRDTVRGIPCYRIRLYCPMGQYVTYFIDDKTYYIVRETGKGAMMCVVMDNNTAPASNTAPGSNMAPGNNTAPAGDISIDFSDYKKTPEGYIFPYTIVTNAFGAKMTIEKVEINHNVDVETLSRPKQTPSQAKRTGAGANTAATGS